MPFGASIETYDSIRSVLIPRIIACGLFQKPCVTFSTCVSGPINEMTRRNSSVLILTLCATPIKLSTDPPMPWLVTGSNPATAVTPRLWASE